MFGEHKPDIGAQNAEGTQTQPQSQLKFFVFDFDLRK